MNKIKEIKAHTSLTEKQVIDLRRLIHKANKQNDSRWYNSLKDLLENGYPESFEVVF